MNQKNRYVDSKIISTLVKEFFDLYEKDKIYECVDKYSELMSLISPETIAQVPSHEINKVKEVSSFVKELLGKNLGSPVSSLLLTAQDWHIMENAVEAAKLEVLFSLPYFDPDKWLEEYFSLNPLVISLNSKLPEKIEKRLYEATYCYIYGFYNACTALCRSTIEGFFKDKFKGKIPEKWTLDNIVNAMKKGSLSDRDAAWNAVKIKTEANKILHNISKSTTKKSCLTILIETRKLLEEMV